MTTHYAPPHRIPRTEIARLRRDWARFQRAYIALVADEAVETPGLADQLRIRSAETLLDLYRIRDVLARSGVPALHLPRVLAVPTTLVGRMYGHMWNPWYMTLYVHRTVCDEFTRRDHNPAAWVELPEDELPALRANTDVVVCGKCVGE